MEREPTYKDDDAALSLGTDHRLLPRTQPQPKIKTHIYIGTLLSFLVNDVQK